MGQLWPVPTQVQSRARQGWETPEWVSQLGGGGRAEPDPRHRWAGGPEERELLPARRWWQPSCRQGDSCNGKDGHRGKGERWGPELRLEGPGPGQEGSPRAPTRGLAADCQGLQGLECHAEALGFCAGGSGEPQEVSEQAEALKTD